MTAFYTKQELLDFGFKSIGENPRISKDVRFYEINGKIGNNVRIDSFTILTGNIEIGDNVHISPFCFLGGTGGLIIFKKNSGISTHVSLFTKSDDYKSHKLDKTDKIFGNISIGENSIIGSGSMIMPGVTVHDNASIGSNSLITEDIDEGSIVISRNIGLITVFKRE